MKKNILSLLFLILFGQLVAQKGFYIKPAVNYLKFYKNNDIGYTFNSKSGSQIEISTKNIYNTFPEILLGINFGYKTSNFFYEVGAYQDGSSNYIGLKYLEYNAIENNYYQGGGYSYSGIAQRSYPIRIGIKIIENNSKIHNKKTFSLYLISGLEIQCNYGSLGQQISRRSFTPNGIDNIYIDISTDRSVKRAYHPSIGLLFEVKNGRDFNLFNLQVNYNISTFKSKELQSRNVRITDIDNQQYYVGRFMSTGSGLYLGISKNIYFNRIFKRK